MSRADRLQRRRRRGARSRAPAAARWRTQPRRLLEGGHADAGGVHQRADLHLRQVALFLDAAVLDHRHVAALAARRVVAAHDARSRRGAAVGLRQPALASPAARRRAAAAAAARRRPRPAAACRLGRRVGQQHRHAADQRLEGRVGAHQQAAVVEQHHADRAQVEPVVELAQRAVGALARHVLGGGVLQHAQVAAAAPSLVDSARRAARNQRSRPLASISRRSSSARLVGRAERPAQALARASRLPAGLPAAAAPSGRVPISCSRA